MPMAQQGPSGLPVGQTGVAGMLMKLQSGGGPQGQGSGLMQMGQQGSAQPLGQTGGARPIGQAAPGGQGINAQATPQQLMMQQQQQQAAVAQQQEAMLREQQRQLHQQVVQGLHPTERASLSAMQPVRLPL
jgi:hypothetical protein